MFPHGALGGRRPLKVSSQTHSQTNAGTNRPNNKKEHRCAHMLRTFSFTFSLKCSQEGILSCTHTRLRTQITQPHLESLSCVAAPLKRHQSGFLQGLRVKGRLWLPARLITGNIEICLSSGVALLSGLVCQKRNVSNHLHFVCVRVYVFETDTLDGDVSAQTHSLHHSCCLHTCV